MAPAVWCYECTATFTKQPIGRPREVLKVLTVSGQLVGVSCSAGLFSSIEGPGLGQRTRSHEWVGPVPASSFRPGAPPVLSSDAASSAGVQGVWYKYGI